jgi:hypothetical protein
VTARIHGGEFKIKKIPRQIYDGKIFYRGDEMSINTQETKTLKNLVLMAALALPVLFFQAFSPSDAIDADDAALSELISGSKAAQMKVVEKDRNENNIDVANKQLEGYLSYDLDAAERQSSRELTMIASVLEGKERNIAKNTREELRITQLELK